MGQGFNNSFEKAFTPAALESMKEKIKQDSTKAEESLKTSANLAMVAEMSKGTDADTQERLAKILEMKHTPESSKAILDFASAQVKDKQNFEQTMQQERFKSGMLGVTEVIKSLSERGGTFADGTPITAASLQDFGKQASDRLLNSIGSTQPGTPVAPGLEGRISNSSQESGTVSNESSQKSNGSGLMNAPIRSKASFKAEEKTASDTAVAEKTSKGTYRFMQQFDRSIKELKSFDPEFDKVGASGWLSRKQASVAEHLDELPETSALKIQVKPMANAMAREIEGGRVTDDDRKIYADSFANGIGNPNVTNMRLMSQSIISLIDKGGDENGKITNQLQMLAKSDTDMFRGVIMQVLEDYPELAPKIYGEGFEVSE